MLNSYIRPIFIISLILSISCSKNPDVRLTFCQDLTQLLLKPSEELEWQEHQTIIKGYQDLEIQIQFTTAEQNSMAHASCFYAYEQDDIGAETFQNPEAAYSTYPGKMILMNKEVEKILLAKSINQVMLQQGKNVINKVKEDLDQASQKAMEKIKQ
ncbi:MAG: hypothetical protein KZQ64_08775 [gamma proteobacterium symbiont of Bathyaustriella thionipta]|nr:hypothetical protein [gamma proteobacterium symbiont of Bathyaustriella thionipta]MCU7949916.1 hypothetical protein [gamma proteobacterium symbiont of Bathyaustriella thionipta]MCU7953466.1 hypothetical protein [gamma proteobacterium symbiont of Bathyaustriella thionipta]MCU7955585.1 hypothetical protein [gamma proteobacterium symbiont of Bathyaustriella thionipta]MCU7965885.1 hypothetical protein [gamma proteobacterium symbiont of Bathyaustriella thionipta]